MKRSLSFVLLLFLLQTSCVKDVDFDQANGFTLTPVFNSSFIYFSFFESDLDNTNLSSEITVVDSIDFLQNWYFELVVRLDFEFKINNEIDKEMIVQVSFLDTDRNNIFDFQPLRIPSGISDFSAFEEIDIIHNSQILDARFISISAIVTDSSNIDFNSTNEFEFRSTVKIYIENEF